MLEFKLFEIPIYSMKEEEYAKRCYKYIEKECGIPRFINENLFQEHLKSPILDSHQQLVYRNPSWLFKFSDDRSKKRD